MSQRRKVYIASQMTQEAINQAFKFLDDQYERVIDAKAAEIIIYDLSNKVKNWPLFLGVEAHNGPVIFAALDQIDQDNWAIIKECFPFEPPVHKSQKDLINKLAETAYHLERTKAAINKQVLDMILAKQKSQS